MTELAFTKGHGTRNDFVLLVDPDGEIALDADLARFLCDRRGGIGGDGVIRLVRAGRLEAGEGFDADAWFMDYWNSDGTTSEMCGNGARVFAAVLEREGEDLSLPVTFGTRGGPRTVVAAGPGMFTIGMGEFSVPAAEDGADSLVGAVGLEPPRPALSVDVGNPHRVTALASVEELEALDLTWQPVVDPVPEHGANVEFAVALGHTADLGRVRMRVHERGSGETQSCGTGACAVAIAMATWAGADAPRTWEVEVPGGVVTVAIDGTSTTLTGPAELVATGTVTLP